MRWRGQSVESEGERSLPGLEVNRVRTFDAPEALGVNFHEIRAKSALNRVPGDYLPFDYTVNPYRGCQHACSYCFARASHTYLDLDAGRDFEREIVVKVNVPELLAAELRRPSWKRDLVAFGTNTDPYQWVEGRYRLMPPMLDALRETRTPASILTKSPLALRDLDRFRALAEVAEVSVSFSIPTLEERAWRQTEPHTPHPRKRLEAVARVREAGIPSGVLVAPLMPGINDDPEQVDEIVRLAREAGASFVSPIALHLRPGVREVFMSWLGEVRPELVERYRRLYSRGSYAEPGERSRLASLVRGWAGGEGRRGRRGAARSRRDPEAASVSSQGRLF